MNVKSLFEARKKYLLLFTAGALADFALAPFYIFPVLFISFPALFTALEKSRNIKQAFWSGWFFGFGYFLFGLYWIANSLLVDAEQFAWLIPFAVSLIPAAAAIYIGVAAAIYKKFAAKSNLGKIFVLASSWTALEFARTYFPFGGFPWNLIGYSALFSLTFAQFAWVGGIFTLSFLVIIIACASIIWKEKIPAVFIIVLITSLYGFGYYHIRYSEREAIGLKMELVQPNIKQEMKWNEETKFQNYQKTLHLAASAAGETKPDLIILPESGAPYHLNREAAPLAMAASIIQQGSTLITGALRSEGNTRATYKAWNTLYMIGEGGIVDYYDKHHIVPFGEYVPFRDILPIEKITPGIGDFSKGAQGKILQLRGKKILPLICYEVIFPQYSDLSERPDFIVNITNDAWFGNSAGPHQHLAAAQMRAIEQGLPLLRVANTGISAIINANGNILKSIELNQTGIISSKVPEKISHKSIYSRFNNLSILLVMIFGVLFSAFRGKRS